jgi:hypothetical protein
LYFTTLYIVFQTVTVSLGNKYWGYTPEDGGLYQKGKHTTIP